MYKRQESAISATKIATIVLSTYHFMFSFNYFFIVFFFIYRICLVFFLICSYLLYVCKRIPHVVFLPMFISSFLCAPIQTPTNQTQQQIKCKFSLSSVGGWKNYMQFLSLLKFSSVGAKKIKCNFSLSNCEVLGAKKLNGPFFFLIVKCCKL